MVGLQRLRTTALQHTKVIFSVQGKLFLFVSTYSYTFWLLRKFYGRGLCLSNHLHFNDNRHLLENMEDKLCKFQPVLELLHLLAR